MEKSPEAFRTISEVAELLETPAHVLRFWESRFPQIRPVKRAGGRRYYRPSDVALLSGIKRLLHEDGLTIRGVQKILQEQGVKHVAGLIDEEAEASLAAEAEPAPAEPIPLFPSPPPEAATRQAALFEDLPEGTSSPEATRAESAEQDTAESLAEPDSLADPGEPPLPAGPEPAPTETELDVPDAIGAASPSEAPPLAPIAESDAVPAGEGAAADPVAQDNLADAVVPDEAEPVEAASPPEPPAPASPEGTEPPPADPAPSAALHPDESSAPTVTAEASVTGAEPAQTLSVAPAPSAPEQPAEAPLRWHASDLRALRATSLHGKADRAEALARRLHALRERLGSAGRPPVR